MSQKRRGIQVLAATVLLAAACPVAPWAQEAAPKPAEAQPAPAPPPVAPRSASAQAANIALAIVLTDKIDGKTVAEEPVHFLLADRQLGRLRRHLPASASFANKNFEVDVTPEIVGSRVRISMTVSYNAGSPDDAHDQTHTTQFVETITTYLDVGKPTTIAETAGDTANRRVALQVTATIIK
jgi:hypothetical protein